MAQIERSGRDFVVDPGILARVFDLTPDQVRAKMQGGDITSRCEQGQGDDAGRWRLTFYYAGRACRVVVDDQGAVITQSSFPVGAARS
ncbi:DUF6522 family protein [Paracoccus sp. (in: a-proteobacteria)]|uniref:DUF6522 family protein n=1 Tax=Paracoccus sp. TaxID=267 RepID=UPI0026E03F76|nr:DUF6522 family protein [Paracoccus sp. (in: a-proteobacteria)]MDO5647121.1 DUF6522 family protein [Paracoccus sp. (in: a-proteobacteria)]